MQYSPKLKTAMDRIKAVLKEYDIAGTVVLHTPGFSEFLLKLDPSYSIAELKGDTIKIKAKKEDFNGDVKARDAALSDTVNMITHFADTNGMVALNMMQVMDMLKKEIDIETNRGNISSHTEQNN